MLQTMATFRHGTQEKLLFLTLVYVDVVVSSFAVSAGFSEINPLMAQLLASPMMLILVKGVTPMVISWLVPSRLLLPSSLFMVLVLGWNFKELAG